MEPREPPWNTAVFLESLNGLPSPFTVLGILCQPPHHEVRLEGLKEKYFYLSEYLGGRPPLFVPSKSREKERIEYFSFHYRPRKPAGNKMLKRSLSVLSSLPAPSLRMEFETTYARFLSPVRRYAFSHEESKNRNRVLSTSSIARLDCASSKNEKRRIETSLDEVFRKEGRIPLNVSFLYSPNIFIPEFYSLHICSIYRPTFAST